MLATLRTLARRGRGKLRQIMFRPYESSRRYGDATLRLSIQDAKGQSWYDHDRDFEPEIERLRPFLETARVVFDLGAHQGVVVQALAHLAPDDAAVVAVEANRPDYEIAVENQRLNAAPNLTILYAAVASESGTLRFARSGRVFTGGAGEQVDEVRALTIDELAGEYGPPDVLFMDVDGSEADALRGATETLKAHPPLYCEVHRDFLADRGDSVADVIATLHVAGYSLHVSAEMRPSRRTFEPYEESLIAGAGYFHLLALPPGE